VPSSQESRFVAVVRFAFRSSKRIAVTVVGGLLVLAGIAMMVLPGPGLLVVVAGFAVLGTEYAWAAAALDRTKATAGRAGQMAKGAAGSSVRVAREAAATTGRAARGAAGGAAGRFQRRRGSGGVGDV
jgi:Putative transmembrane protein (PGPGW)